MADADVAGWHLTYEQPTGACYGLTVGVSELAAARALAEQHSAFLKGDVLVEHGTVDRAALVDFGVTPGVAVLTNP